LPACAQLTFRRLPRDFGEPNCNADHLAAKFSNAIMPARGRLHDQRSTFIKINRVSCGQHWRSSPLGDADSGMHSLHLAVADLAM
jgi:hypothetical protein